MKELINIDQIIMAAQHFKCIFPYSGKGFYTVKGASSRSFRIPAHNISGRRKEGKKPFNVNQEGTRPVEHTQDSESLYFGSENEMLQKRVKAEIRNGFRESHTLK